MRKVPVGIIGAGPVGVGLAIDLGSRGIDCVVLEKRPTISRIPKGQYLQQRTMDIFDMWDVEDEVRAARLMPEDYPIGEVTCFGSLSSDVFFSPPERETVQMYYFQRNDRMPQYQMEGALRAKAAELAAVDLRLGVEARQIREVDGVVEVDANTPEGQTTLQFDYLVGCDGGGSLVRDYLKIDRHGATFASDRLMLVVFNSPELDEFLVRHLGPKSTYRAIDPRAEGSWKFLGRVDNDSTFFYHGPIDKNDDRDSCKVDELLYDFAGFSFDFTETYRGVWDARVRVADQYRRGNILLAGDAAHTHPPYGGFGVNNGLEDAANLGWKLAALVQGWAGDGLLESYDLERREVFDELGNKVIAAGVYREADFFQQHSLEEDGADKFVALFAELATEMVRDRTVQYVPHYDGSNVVVGSSGNSTGVIGEYSPRASAGRTLVPQPLSSGRNVFEELGPWFTLVDFSDGSDEARALIAEAEALGVPLVVVRDDAQGERNNYQSRFVLVRPDRFIAWAGDDVPADVAGLWSSLCGRP